MIYKTLNSLNLNFCLQVFVVHWDFLQTNFLFVVCDVIVILVIFLQLNSSIDGDEELAIFSMLLPAAPVLELQQLRVDNESANVSEPIV